MQQSIKKYHVPDWCDKHRPPRALHFGVNAPWLEYQHSYGVSLKWSACGRWRLSHQSGMYFFSITRGPFLLLTLCHSHIFFTRKFLSFCAIYRDPSRVPTLRWPTRWHHLLFYWPYKTKRLFATSTSLSMARWTCPRRNLPKRSQPDQTLPSLMHRSWLRYWHEKVSSNNDILYSFYIYIYHLVKIETHGSL